MSYRVGEKQAVIGTAAAEYANRPKDEQYPSVEALIERADHDRESSRERHYNLKDLSAVADDRSVSIASQAGIATFTNWSFGQFCRMLKAPAAFLRELTPSIAANVLNDCLHRTPAGSKATLLVQAPNGKPYPQVRSVTSETYGRLYDGELYTGLRATLPKFELPPTWEGGKDGPRSGAYRGDRDSFVIMVDGGSIVTDPSIQGAGKDGRMFRGIMVRNSEVGACSVTIEQVLFEYICGNHNLWGAVIDRRFRRRHVGGHVLRDTIREIATIARKWSDRPASVDQAIVNFLISHELASTKEGIIDELRAIGLTEQDAKEAYATCELGFEASPRSFWGISQGITRLSQTSGYQDDRFMLDTAAAKILAKGAALVAA